MADSESEKQGMTVLGCRLSNSVEHVPIKKRRFLCRSPSPPPRTSLSYLGEVTGGECVSSQKFHSEEGNNCQDSSCISDVDQLVNKEVNVDACKLEKITDQFDDISHLPNVSIVTSTGFGKNPERITKSAGVLESAAILDTSLSLLTELSAKGDEHSAEISTRATHSCTTGPVTEVVAPCRAKNPFTRNLADGKDVDFLYLPGNPEDASRSSTGNVTVRTPKASLQDDRLHWDLNLEADAWEHPLDFQHMDPRISVEDITFKDVENEKSKDLEVYDGLQMKLGVADCSNEKVELPRVAGGLASESRESNPEELPNKDTTTSILDRGLDSYTVSGICNSDGCNIQSQALVNQDFCPFQIVGPSFPSGVTSLSSLQISSSDSCTDHSVLSKCQHSSSKFALDGLCKSHKNVEDPSNVHGDHSGSKEAVGVGTNPSRTEALDLAMHNKILRLTDSASPFSLGASERDQIAETLDNCMQRVSLDHCDQASRQGHIKAEQTTSTSSGNSAALNEKPYVLNSHDVADITCSNDLGNSSDKLANCEYSENYNSDFSQNDGGIGTEISEVQADYDSQYEDGELRESNDCTWEEYAMGNSVVHEGSRCDTFTSVQIKEEENNSRSYADRNRLVSDGDVLMNGRGIDVMMEKTTATGSSKEQVIRHSQSCHGARYPNKVSTASAVPVQVEDKQGVAHGSKATDTKIVEFRARRRELQSFMSGRLNRDLSPRNDRLHRRGYQKDSYLTEFVGGSRYSLHTYKVGHQHNHISPSEGNDSLGRRHSYGYDGPEELHYQGPRNSVRNYGKLENNGLVVSGGNISKPIGLDSRRTTDPSSRLGDRLLRSRLPAIMNETFGMHVRRLAEDMNHDGCMTANHRSYGRSGPRFHENDYMRRYHRPPSDDWTRSLRNSNLGGRRRSFSPTERNDYSYSCQSKSPSRLRTRHLDDSQSPKGRGRSNFVGNPYSRHQSRSPDFSKHGGMRRLRPSPQRRGFLEDNVAGLMSMSRRHGSPLHYSKWNDNRSDDDVSHFRKQDFSQHSSIIERQNLPRGERLDYAYSMRKERSNDHFNSASSRRLSRENDVARGGPRHRDNDDDSAHGYQHALVRPQRDHGIDGAKKPVRHDQADGFAAEHVSQNKDAAELHERGSSLDYRKATDNKIDNVSEGIQRTGEHSRITTRRRHKC